MENNFIIYLGISLLILHEIDAIRANEWKIINGVSSWVFKIGHFLITIVQLPLIILLLWYIETKGIHKSILYIFDIFLLMHVGSHLFIFRLKENPFTHWLSWAIIIGTSVCGAVDMVLRLLGC
jgi:hypothetical protein